MPENIVSAVPPSFAEPLFARLLGLPGSVEITNGDGRFVSFYSRDNRTFIYSVGPDGSERLHDRQAAHLEVIELERQRADELLHAILPAPAVADPHARSGHQRPAH